MPDLTFGEKIDLARKLRKACVEAWNISQQLGNAGLAYEVNPITESLWKCNEKARTLLGSLLVEADGD